MQNSIQQTVSEYLPARRKSTTGGWIAFNAVCCIHNGETQDKKKRGGIIFGADGAINYHCFNCQFKTSWRPGRGISLKFRKWLSWLSMPEDTISRLRLDVLRYADEKIVPLAKKPDVQFDEIQLPEGSSTFEEWYVWNKLSSDTQQKEIPANLVDVIEYADQRKVISPSLVWCNQETDKLNRRLIIPFTYQGKLVGYTARIIDKGVLPKYLTVTPTGYVFNIDNQRRQNRFVLLSEGPMDALAVDGIAVLSNNINETQIRLISALQTQVIVVPHKDSSGKKLIDIAIEQGWAVSFPDWHETCKDPSAAVEMYGKIFTIKNIIDRTETSSLKIKLMTKKLFQF